VEKHDKNSLCIVGVPAEFETVISQIQNRFRVRTFSAGEEEEQKEREAGQTEIKQMLGKQAESHSLEETIRFLSSESQVLTLISDLQVAFKPFYHSLSLSLGFYPDYSLAKNPSRFISTEIQSLSTSRVS
jgi:hypothetical protein